MKSLFTKVVKDIDDLVLLAKQVDSTVKRVCVILLSGDLGAGKTTFVSEFCKLHNISGVSSPTYAIHNRYESSGIAISHLDLYRLDDEEKLESAGVSDILRQKVDYIFIEWPEHFPELEKFFGIPVYKLNLTKTGENERQAELFQIS